MTLSKDEVAIWNQAKLPGPGAAQDRCLRAGKEGSVKSSLAVVAR